MSTKIYIRLLKSDDGGLQTQDEYCSLEKVLKMLHHPTSCTDNTDNYFY